MKKRLLAMALVMVMTLALMPIAVAETEPTTMADPSIGSSDYATVSREDQKQCVWYALGRYKQLGGQQDLSGLGNARDWCSNAKKKGLAVGSTPKVGAVACWNAKSSGGFSDGHVAVVEWVSQNGAWCRVSQYNRGVKDGGKNKFGGYNDSYKWTANYLEKVPGASFPPKPDCYIYPQATTTQAKTFTVTFDPNGGSMVAAKKTFTVGKNERIGALPTPTRTGYKFYGWEFAYRAPSDYDPRESSTRASIYEDTNAEMYGDTDYTVYAGWGYCDYVVNFNANGGIVSTNSKTIYYSTSYGDLPIPTRSDYTFDGWYTSVSGGNRVTNDTKVTTTGNLTLYAHWTRTPVTPDCSDGHTWGEWTTVTAATCTSEGLEQHICEFCGFVQKSEIPMSGHNYQATQETDTYIRYTCASCKDSYTVDKDPICETVGHIWGEWTAIRSATCTSAGQQEHTCTVCGKIESELLAYLHHSYELTRSTSTKDIYTCSMCGNSYTETKEAGTTIADTDYFDTPVNSSSGMANFTESYHYYDGLFSDVNYSNWFYLNISTAYEYGLMKGTGSNTFSPNNNVTIAEAITLAARIHRIYNTRSDDFSTYDGGNWYDPYVDYARANGIVNTYYDYTRPATREQFVHILAQALPQSELTNIAGAVSFADSSDVTYAADVKLLSGAGVINGIPENGQTYFKPWNAITRAEVAAVVSRMVQPGTRIGASSLAQSNTSNGSASTSSDLGESVDKLKELIEAL